MISPSLERFYIDINKHILLAESYSEIPELEFIIKSCRLKPYKMLSDNKNIKLVLHKQWFDEYNNSLFIIKRKILKIKYNDLSIDKNNIVCTDLYFGLSISKIIKISKLAFISVTTDEDNEKQYFLTLLGIDNYLRTYINIENDWQQISPLYLGINNLKNIANNIDIKYFREFKNKDVAPIPCIECRQWLSFMPPSVDFIKLLNKEYGNSFMLKE